MEIYVDIVERLSATFDPNGIVVMGEVNGAVVVRSFLGSSMSLRMALSPDVVLGAGGTAQRAVLSDYSFHACVNTDRFETEKIMEWLPQDGEVTLMNYRSEFRFYFISAMNTTTLRSPIVLCILMILFLPADQLLSLNLLFALSLRPKFLDPTN